MMVFFSSRHMEVVRNLFFLRLFVFTTNHGPAFPFLPLCVPIRPSRYLSAVLVSCSLTSDSKYNILPLPAPAVVILFALLAPLLARGIRTRMEDLGYPRSNRGMSS